jgi:hypothetical protein
VILGPLLYAARSNVVSTAQADRQHECLLTTGHGAGGGR